MPTPWERRQAARAGGVRPIIQDAPDAKSPIENAQIQAQTQSAIASASRAGQQNADDAATRPFRVREASAKATAAEVEAAAARKRQANNFLPPEKVAELQGNLGQIEALEATLADLRGQYNKNFATYRNPLELLPGNLRPANGVFNDTAGRLLSQVSRAQGLTAQQFNTPAEQKMFFEPYIPKAADTDERILAKLKGLQEMASKGRASTMRQLGRNPPPATPARSLRGPPPRNAPRRVIDFKDLP